MCRIYKIVFVFIYISFYSIIKFKNIAYFYIRENIKIFDFELTDEEMKQMRSLNKEKRFFNMSLKDKERIYLGNSQLPQNKFWISSWYIECFDGKEITLESYSTNNTKTAKRKICEIHIVFKLSVKQKSGRINALPLFYIYTLYAYYSSLSLIYTCFLFI